MSYMIYDEMLDFVYHNNNIDEATIYMRFSEAFVANNMSFVDCLFDISFQLC